MGNAFSNAEEVSDLVYTAPVNADDSAAPDPLHPNRSAVYRSATHPSELVSSLVEGGIDNGYDIFQRGCRLARTRPCLGRRKRVEVDGKVTSGDYEWWTYGEVEAISQMLGSGILYRDLVAEASFPDEQYEQARKLRCLGICSKNRVEWFALEQAANAYSFTLVPLYDTLGDEAMSYMITATKMSCIAATSESFPTIMKLLERPDSQHSVKAIICFDEPDEQEKLRAKNANIELHYWLDLTSEGKAKGIAPLRLPKREDVGTICFTSGTTGFPKGALLTHSAFAATVCGALRGPFTETRLVIDHQDTYMSYLPLAHVLERALVLLMFIHGAKVAIYSGEAKTLLDDIKVAKPTIFASVPRLFMRINDKINAGVNENSAVARYLFNVALDTKIERLRKTGDVTHRVWDTLVFSKIKALMGGRLRYMLSGGAALELSVQERMSVLFCCPFLEGYGLTETLGATFIRKVCDRIYGHVGSPLPSCELVIESVPDMDYDATTEPPMGEMLLRGPQVMPGYFLRPDATAEAFTEDGWFRTGDIIVRMSEGGRIKIIDRKKNMFKLAQGEYVAAERIESVYAQAALVAQVYVYGDSSRTALVAIICPDDEEVAKWIQSVQDVKLQSDLLAMAPEELMKAPALRSIVKDQLIERETALGLKGFERIKAFYLESDQFSVENDLLTPTYKLKRHLIAKKYKDVIAQLYTNI